MVYQHIGDTLGKIETPDKTVEVLLQRVPRNENLFSEINCLTQAQSPQSFDF